MSQFVKSVSRVVKRPYLRPSDHGRAISLEDFEHAKGQQGYRYELIDGRVEVSPEADQPHDDLGEWVADQLREYRRSHRDEIGKISVHARVHVPGRRAPTCPEPDLAAYRPVRFIPLRLRNWQKISPFLVAEVLSPGTLKKDLERNVEIYRQVPTIREYWIIDQRIDPDQPTLIVYRRRGQNWQKPIVVPFGGTYETNMLPGFMLVVEPKD